MLKLFVNNVQIGNYDDITALIKGVILSTQGHIINMDSISFEEGVCRINYSVDDNNGCAFDDGEEVVYEGIRCKVVESHNEWVYDLKAIGNGNEELCEDFYSIPQEFVFKR